MATAQNLVFGGDILVNITGVGGFYKQINRTADATNFRSIKFHNTAYRVLRTVGLAQTNATAQTFVFDCISEVADESTGEGLITVLTNYQQGGVGNTLVFATPTFNGAQRTLTNMVLNSFPLGAPVIQAPAQGSLWRVHFRVKFVRYGT